MKKDGLTFTILAFICSGLGLVFVLVLSRSTESTLIGRASDAINRLNRPGPEKTLLMNNIPVAYAVSYHVGTACIVWFLPNLGPKPMGVNLKEERRKLQAQISSGEEPEADDKSLLDFPQDFLDVVITNKALAGRPFREQAGMESARGVFLMNPLILLGACSGAGTITAALRAVQDEAQCKLPALGYSVPMPSATSC